MIRDIDKTTATGWAAVDNGWTDHPDILVAKFTLVGDHPGELPVRGYFFNADRQLVYQYRGTPRVQVKGSAYQEPLRDPKSGRHELAFPIPPSVAAPGPLRWKAFIVEIGGGDNVARFAYPTGVNVADYDLAQKATRAVADPPAAPASGLPPAAGTPAASDAGTRLSIKSVGRFRNAMNGWVNSSWVSGLNTLRVKLRLDSGAARGGFFARAYFFDKNKQLVLEYKAPPQVEVKLGEKYATLPPVWKDGGTYEVFFPIPADKEKGANAWKTAIVVFGNSEMAVADAYPATAVNLNDFSFPERDRVEKSPAGP